MTFPEVLQVFLLFFTTFSWNLRILGLLAILLLVDKTIGELNRATPVFAKTLQFEP